MFYLIKLTSVPVYHEEREARETEGTWPPRPQ